MATGLIDPGSAACTIKTMIVTQNNLQMKSQPIDLRSFGPEHFKVHSPGIVVLDVVIDGVKVQDVDFRVVPDNAQAVETIIGRTYTDHPRVNYHKVGDQLKFESAPEILPIDCIQYNDNDQQQISIKDETIPPHLVSFVNVMNHDEQWMMPVINANDTTTKIPAGTLISRSVISNPPILQIRTEKEPVTRGELNIGEDVSDEVANELTNLLNTYRDTIAKTIYEIGCTDLVTMDINEIPGSRPVMRRLYKASDKNREKIRKNVKEWKDVGVATETTSRYASPVLLVQKKTGEDRLVVDYGPLNRQTERIHFPLPDLDEHLRLLGNAEVFITLDLAHGYLQVPLTPEAREKTAFITPDETGEFTRVIFGLMNAPFFFSKVMQLALGELRNRVAMFYLDDILIPGMDWPDLKNRLIQVLEALRRAGLTINIRKSHFIVKEVEYLGNTISKQGIRPGERKVMALTQYPTPTDKHEIRRFHGLASFFRKFVPTFALKAEPLTKLLRKNVEFRWGSEQEAAYRDLQDSITHRPVLKPFNATHETELHTDASAKGIGAMLLQRDDNGELRLVYAISRRTTEPEQRYHSSKMELLAIIWAVSRLRPMLINVKFKIISDCQALIYLNTMKLNNAQVARWYSTLTEFEFDIEHRPGTKMAHVDALSRAPVEPPEDEGIAEARLDGTFAIVEEDEEILLYQHGDENLRQTAEILRKPEKNRTKYEKSEVNGYELHEGILYKRRGEELLFVIPKAMRKSMLVRHHDLQSHQGLDRTIAKIMSRYYFPGIRRYAKQHIRACIACVKTKPRPGRQPGELHPIPPGHRPFATLHIDHLGPYVTSNRKNKYVLVMVDNLTKYCIIKATRNTKVLNVVKTLEDFVLMFGAPERIISDRGTCFTAEKFAKLCSKHGIKHVLNSPRHPQANGQVERLNASITPAIQVNLKDEWGKDWDVPLKEIQRDLNESMNKTTGMSPFQALYGYIPRHDEGNLRTLTHPTTDKYQLPQQLQEEIRQVIARKQDKYKTRYDKNRLPGIKYDVGEIVFIKKPPDATGDSTKLQSKMRGPLMVTKVLPGDTYRVADLNVDKRGRQYAATAHVSQMKPWKPQEEDDGESSQGSGHEEETDVEDGAMDELSREESEPLIEEERVVRGDEREQVNAEPESRARVSKRQRRKPQRLGYL